MFLIELVEYICMICSCMCSSLENFTKFGELASPSNKQFALNLLTVSRKTSGLLKRSPSSSWLFIMILVDKNQEEFHIISGEDGGQYRAS